MENTFNPKQQKMVAIASCTAIGDLAQLKTELNGGLDAGLTVNQVKEMQVHLYAYVGFPRSLQGINTLMSVVDERKARGIHDPAGPEATPITDTRDKYVRGREILETLTQTDQKQVTGANAFAPAIDVFLKEHLFADIFERDVLTFTEREITTLAALCSLNNIEPMVASHMNMNLNLGVTVPQIEQLISIVGTVAGPQQEAMVSGVLRNVLNNRNQ